MTAAASDHLALADWRRRTASLYADLRADARPAAVRHADFWSARDRLYLEHPASPIPPTGRAGFHGIPRYGHDPLLAVTAPLEPDPAAPELDVPRSGEGASMPFVRIGWVSFAVDGSSMRLAVFWLREYAGGIFIPFRDATSGSETYGAGRYLWDSAKGADLGSVGDELVLDFNYAYHPSCVHDPRWSCPLAPPESRLAVPIRGGERLADGAHP